MKSLTIISTFIAFSIVAMAQTSYISYTYDHAGNRKDRVLVLPENQQSTTGNISQVPNNSALSQESKDGATLSGTNQQPTYNDVVSGHSVTIYPNPTNGILKVNINNLQITGTDKITVYDTNGKTWLEKTVTDENTELNISERLAGTYFMRLNVSGEETVWTIVKQ